MNELRLYDYAASANCLKVRVLLALLRRPYARVPIDIFAGETLTEQFAALNPARATPVLELPDGTCLAESGAILFHLAEGTPYLPQDPVDRAQVLRWLFVEQTEVIPTMGGLRFRLATGRLRAEDPDAIRRHAGSLEVLALYEGRLREREFLVGERCTIADIAGHAYIHVAPEAGVDLAGFPAVRAWLARIEALPGFVNDLQPYPANARAGAGRSIYG
jgi:glutathione S-transferase